MSEPMRHLSDEGLGAALKAVATQVDYPPTPEMSRQIRARIQAAPEPHRVPLRSRRYAFALAVVGVLVVGFAAIMALSPRAREAVADFIGVGGVRIGFDMPSPSVSPADELDLGPEVTLEEAEGFVGFDVKTPQLADLPEPEIHLTTPPSSGMVSLLYRDAYRDADDPGLLITQFEARLEEGFLKKLAFEEGARVEYLIVRGSPGYWVTGTHFFAYFDESGDIREETLRLADNVLLWEENGITHRVEGGFDKAKALRIADSMPD
jgi:hypothetical protein